MGKSDLVSQFKAARRVSVPLVVVTTPDPAATVKALLGAASNEKEPPTVIWDIINGLRGVNAQGVEAVKVLVPPPTDPAQATANPAEALSLARNLPRLSLLFFCNAHRFIENEAVSQAVWNLRDLFKSDGRTLILLAPQIKLPLELQQDVVILDEPLPDDEQLKGVIKDLHEVASLAQPKPGEVQRILNAVRGVAVFPAEQSIAMSLEKTGIDKDALWERKRKVVEQTDGLSVWRGGERFDEIGGLEEFKGFAKKIVASGGFGAVWWIDEIEKGMAAMQTDTSGVSQDQHQAMLTFLQDNRIPAMLLIGQPGSGKSLGAKAIGAEAGVPTIRMDMGALKGSLVGQSEQLIRSAFKVLMAISQGRLLLVATCNDVGSLERSPELMRRFKLPKFYFDLPTDDEKAAIWPISGKRHGVDTVKRPNDKGWTGAEIDTCCEIAAMLKVSVVEAAQYVVPMIQSQPQIVEARRRAADGRFLSASYPGTYTMAQATANVGGRAISLN